MIKRLLVTALILLLSSCAMIPTSEQLQVLENDLESLNAAIDKRQEEVSSQFNDVQLNVAKVNKAIQDSNSILDAVSNVNKLSAPVNPYSGTIDAVLKAIAAVVATGVAGGGAVVAVKKSRESAGKTTELNRVLAAVNKLASEASPEEGKKINEVVNNTS